MIRAERCSLELGAQSSYVPLARPVRRNKGVQRLPSACLALPPASGRVLGQEAAAMGLWSCFFLP